MFRKAIILAALAILFTASSAQAQATIPGFVLNPTIADFTASPDHNATAPLSGTPLLTEYRANYYLLDALGNITGQPVLTLSLNKPAPNAQGRIVIADPFGGISQNTAYRMVVTAVGPGGTTASAPSDPFGRETVAAPRASGKPALGSGQ
jgi:hypothetical protein